jgi:hypothetical protein
MLFLLFISPLILYINSSVIPLRVSFSEVKTAMEVFFIVQIVFCCADFFVRIRTGSGINANFGDVISGTFRNPFVYKPDSANVKFVFLITMLLYFYISWFGRSVNKIIVFLLSVFIILASVNHLILAFSVALLVSRLLLIRDLKYRQILAVPIGLFVLGVSYYYIQPVNFNVILNRIQQLGLAISDINKFEELSFKAEFIVRCLRDFGAEPFKFLIFGSGGGTYSSRAALVFSGEYINGFPWIAVSNYMAENCLELWRQMLAAPPDQSGAFNFPYFSVMTLVMELGLIISSIFWVCFFHRLAWLGKVDRLWLFGFILLACLIDNYLEYFQVFGVLFLIFWSMESAIEKPGTKKPSIGRKVYDVA